MLIFIESMRNRSNIVKSKRLKFIRSLMYLDALMLLLSLLRIDVRTFTWQSCSGICTRILVLIIVFVVLLLVEKNLSRYLRRHRSEE